MIIFLLKNLNDINIDILKRYFRRRIKCKIDWNSKVSIVKGTIITSLQVFERIIKKFKFRIVKHMICFFFLSSFTLITSIPLLMTLPLVEIEQPVKVQTIVCESKENKLFMQELNFFNVTHIRKEKKIKPKISVKIDAMVNPELNIFASKSLNKRNAGGKSEISEAYSISHISEKLKPINCIYEKQIKYWCEHKMIDYILEFKKYKLGVSVVRAFSKKEEFSHKQGTLLLRKKIEGILAAKTIISNFHYFNKSVIHIICESERISEIILDCLKKLKDDFEIKDKILIWISVSSIQSIFTNKF